ncbi:SulP family inorganic anion transporter [Muriventricola aceti]|uniref:SulP family inorganic anion transporter n=1 Tax=Muriventricola aceti TaxID=2981773 RepID=UPI000821BA1C|nr:SulP family inorganic anion transporter [Muriventricola aceti]MCU6703683.1 SulP family inorganic anion transporter [Muriventricola aceti]SCJ56943.1 Putative sulfate transporter ychM [uncultured Flavonifractor sp.]
MTDLKPQLFRCLKGYSKDRFLKDLAAGVIVAIIALPLSIALALASGVSPEQGLYTAIVAGFLISALGGSKVQIAGPTAAFATIVAGIVARSGMAGLATATLLAGVMLVLMGILHMGSMIKFIPYTITIGFTAGIAVTIVIGQLKDFFGLTFQQAPVETMEKLEEVVRTFHTVNPAAMAVGILSLSILLLWPRVSQRIPASLIAVLLTAAVVGLLDLPVNTIGDLYVISSALPEFQMPDLSYETVSAVLPDAFTIAVLAAIESLLSAVVADEMIGSRHNSNMELVAQGVGNSASALFGGIPATGAIARTAANIKNGGTSPVAGMVHALVLLLVLVLLMPYAALIPMPCIAAILFQVAYNMSGWRTVLKVAKTSPKSDIAVLVLTFILTVAFDLVVAIGVGLSLACLLFMKRMADVAVVKEWEYVEDTGDEQGRLKPVPAYVMVYEISGPMFFGAADKIPHMERDNGCRVLILRMRSVPAMDITALNGLRRLYDECVRKNINVVFSHVNEQPMSVFRKSGMYDLVGAENFQPNIDVALERAISIGGMPV